MKNEFVTYEQALALKELGFNEPCFAKYTVIPEDNINWFTIPEQSLNNGKRTFGRNENYNTNFFEKEGTISTPTLSQAFRWFRDKYDLQGYVYSTTVRGNRDGKHFSDYCWNINGIDMPFIKTDARDMENITYEEAESACLDKLIEIVKNK